MMARSLPAPGLLAVLIFVLVLAGSSWHARAAAGNATCGPDCSSVFIEPLFRACLLAIQPKRVVFPEDPTYGDARLAFNARVSRFPAAVFYAHSATEVSEAVKCGAAWGVPVTPAAGRQGFQAACIQTGYLVVDVTNITETTLSADKKSFTVGAGNSNIMTVSALHAANVTGAAVTTGVCAFVGSSGFNLGGGFGPLGRYLGLGCDNVIGLEVVLADGSIVQANSTSHSDLLWASCGGGGGTFGVVTSFTYNLTILPNGGKLSAVQIMYTPGVETTVAAFMAFQNALPTLSRRFGFTHDLSKATFMLVGLFLGEPQEALQLLKAAGMLDNLDAQSVATPAESDVAANVSAGLFIKSYPSYYQLAAEKVVPTWAPGFVPWGSADNFTPTPANLDFMYRLMAGKEPGMHVVGGAGYNVWHFSQSRLVGLLPEEGVRAVVQFSQDTVTACALSNFTSPDCLLSIGGHILGGAYADKPADATAFPHRDKYFILDAVVSVTPDMAGIFAASPELLPVLAMPADITNRFLATIQPYLTPSEAAYVNYQPPALANFEEAYFGANAPRLRAIKAQYDPLGLFSKPYTVQGVPAASQGEGGGSADGGTAPAPAAPTPAPAPPPSGAAAGMRMGATAWLAAILAVAAAIAALF